MYKKKISYNLFVWANHIIKLIKVAVYKRKNSDEIYAKDWGGSSQKNLVLYKKKST